MSCPGYRNQYSEAWRHLWKRRQIGQISKIRRSIAAALLLTNCATIAPVARRIAPASQPASAPASQAVELPDCLFAYAPGQQMTGPYLTSRDCLVLYAQKRAEQQGYADEMLRNAYDAQRIAQDDARETHAKLAAAQVWQIVGPIIGTIGGATVAALIARSAK